MFVYIYYKVYYFWANQKSRTNINQEKWPMRPSSSSAESKYQTVKCRSRKTDWYAGCIHICLFISFSRNNRIWASAQKTESVNCILMWMKKKHHYQGLGIIKTNSHILVSHKITFEHITKVWIVLSYCTYFNRHVSSDLIIKNIYILYNNNV